MLGLKFRFRRAFWGASLALVAGFALLTMALFQFQADMALVVGFLSTIVYWFSELIHHLGHAVAARSTGYPMSGVTFGVMGGFLAASRYPKDEPPLPPMTHIRRALGGPAASLIVTIIIGLIWILFFTPAGVVQGRQAGWYEVFAVVLIYAFILNLFVLTLQVFIPLSFNDGGTIWRAWKQRHEAAIMM